MNRFLLMVAVLVLLVTLAWNAGEQHYRGCVDAAMARTEGVHIPPAIDQATGAEVSGGPRIKAVKGCSRWP